MKIFLTVGSMLPFPRLVRAVDAWAARTPQAEVFAQIGDGAETPQNFSSSPMLTPKSYRQHFAEADLVVSHVGMGTVITAAALDRPLLLLPRRPDLGEVTSGHQLATAQWLRDKPGITIAEEAAQLVSLLDAGAWRAGRIDVASHARTDLLQAVRQFIHSS